MTDDPIMSEIHQAIATLQRGDRADARRHFQAIWARIEAGPKPFHECTLAHFMADAQDDLARELEWDQRALDAALRCSDAEAKEHHESLSIAAFLPSLHLNLADGLLRAGDLAACRQHLDAGLRACGGLPDTPYARNIQGGLKRVAERLIEKADTVTDSGETVLIGEQPFQRASTRHGS